MTLLRKLFVVALLVLSTLAVAAKPLTFSLNRLVDNNVVQVSQDSWQGKHLLIAVGFTGCPDVCPTTLLDIKEALAEMDKQPENAKKIQPLFITIDPISDTLTDITRYGAYFDPRIIGLRADDFTALDNVVKQLRASYGYQFDGKPVAPPNLPKGYTVMHSTFIYLYSPKGELLDVYPYNMDGKTLANRILSHL